MNASSNVKIISINADCNAVCAAAARISTTVGTADEIFLKSKDNYKNSSLISKVLDSGHQSIIEHATFTIAFTNVSAFVEQFFIEHRLASFTVKSRRYVDFSNIGYYIPIDLDGDSRTSYKQLMDTAIIVYEQLLKFGIPKEDARFALPYSFYSNFYCTINARELMHIINSIRLGRGRNILELQDVAKQLVEQLEEQFPVILDNLSDHSYDYVTNNIVTKNDAILVDASEVGSVKLVSKPCNPAELLDTALRISGSSMTFAELVHSERPRALEHLNYSFVVEDVTLAGITHFTRHRMQSLIVPFIETASCNGRFIVPDSIKQNAQALERYIWLCKYAHDFAKTAAENDILRHHMHYFALSGNLLDIMLTMNARELLLFMQLRMCSRAQWEIRKVAGDMLSLLREEYSVLFNLYGPSCYVQGHCPENKLTCGQQATIIKKLGTDN